MLDSDSLFFQKCYANNCYLNLNKIANFSGRLLSVSLLPHSDYSKFVSIYIHNNLGVMASGLQSRSRDFKSQSFGFFRGVKVGDKILAIKGVENQIRTKIKASVRVMWILLRLRISSRL